MHHIQINTANTIFNCMGSHLTQQSNNKHEAIHTALHAQTHALHLWPTTINLHINIVIIIKLLLYRLPGKIDYSTVNAGIHWLFPRSVTCQERDELSILHRTHGI